MAADPATLPDGSPAEVASLATTSPPPLSTEAGEATSAAELDGGAVEADSSPDSLAIVTPEASPEADASNVPALCCELSTSCAHGGPTERARCDAPGGWATWRVGPNGSAVGGNCLTTPAEVGDSCAWPAGSTASFANCGAAGVVVRCG